MQSKNKVQGHSNQIPRFEVGVRVDGYTVRGELRHINSAFFTYRLKDQTVALPQLLLETEVQ